MSIRTFLNWITGRPDKAIDLHRLETSLKDLCIEVGVKAILVKLNQQVWVDVSGAFKTAKQIQDSNIVIAKAVYTFCRHIGIVPDSVVIERYDNVIIIVKFEKCQLS